jgi:mono/diheme cytochrome c family protein
LTGSIFDSTDLFVQNQAADAAAAAARAGKTAPSSAPAAATAAVASPLNGVFSAAQAARGAAVFQQQCGNCHGPEDHAGAAFKAKWGGGTVADMYRTISTTMPQGNAGGLSREEYAGIVAFYLRQSGFTAGQQDLPSDPAALAKLPVGN